MNKELQDLAWSLLPKEFKEEVKKEWKTANNEERLSHDAFLRGCYSTMTLLFGLHNLTSDAEGEEILTVSRKNVQKMYSYNEEELTKDPTNKGALLLKLRLDALFGYKCLPDEGTDCTPVEVGVAENATTSNVDSPEDNVGSLEPKPAEPTDTKSEDFDRILKDGFRNHNRMHVAAMAMQGMLSNTTRFSSYEISDLVRISLNCADALIKKAEGGSDE